MFLALNMKLLIVLEGYRLNNDLTFDINGTTLIIEANPVETLSDGQLFSSKREMTRHLSFVKRQYSFLYSGMVYKMLYNNV